MGQTLSLGTGDHVGYVEHCWGETLRSVLPGLVIQVKAKPVKVGWVEQNIKASKRKQVYRGQAATQGRLVE